jgi:hypothetical protein
MLDKENYEESVRKFEKYVEDTWRGSGSTVKDRTEMKVDGYKASKYVVDPGGAQPEQVFVLSSAPSYNVKGKESYLYYFHAYYHNEHLKNNFDTILSTFRWKNPAE